MARRRAWGAAALPLALACSGAPRDLALSFPVSDAAGTEVLTIGRGAELTAQVISLAEGSVALEGDFRADDELSIEAWIYDESPEALGLAIGPLSGQDDTRRSIAPRAVFAAEVHQGEAGAWSARSDPSGDRQRFLPRIGAHCSQLSAAPEGVLLIGDDHDLWGGMARLEDRGALVITQSGGFTSPRFHLVTRSEVLELPVGLGNEVVTTVEQAEDGEIWLTTSGFVPELRFALYSARPADLIQRPGSALVRRDLGDSERCEVQDLASTRTGTITTLYALNRCGTLERFDGVHWRRMLSLTSTAIPEPCRIWSMPFDHRTTLLRLQSGELIYVPFSTGPSEPLALRSTNLCRMRTTPPYTVVTERVEPPPDSVLAMTGGQDGTALAGTTGGYVYARAGTWSPVRPPIIATVGVVGLFPFNGGVLIGGTDGDIDQLYVGRSPCGQPTHLAIDLSVLGAVDLGDTVIASGNQLVRPDGHLRPFAGRVLVDR